MLSAQDYISAYHKKIYTSSGSGSVYPSVIPSDLSSIKPEYAITDYKLLTPTGNKSSIYVKADDLTGVSQYLNMGQKFINNYDTKIEQAKYINYDTMEYFDDGKIEAYKGNQSIINEKFPYYLTEVVIQGRKIKDVFDKGSIMGTIKDADGKEYSVDDFFSKFGDYLVTVREDGEYIGNIGFLYKDGEREYIDKNIVVGGIAYSCQSDGQPFIEKDLSQWQEDKKETLSMYVLDINGYLYPYFINYDYFYSLWLHKQYRFLGRDWSYSYDESSAGHGISNSGPLEIDGDYYVYSGVKGNSSVFNNNFSCYIPDISYEKGYRYVERHRNVVNNSSLYLENLSQKERIISFQYKTDREEEKYVIGDVIPLTFTMFNREYLENYFNAFNVKFRYKKFDSFKQGQKVRHPSLMNQSQVLQVKKVRHQSLMNQSQVLQVKKVRHIINRG